MFEQTFEKILKEGPLSDSSLDDIYNRFVTEDPVGGVNGVYDAYDAYDIGKKLVKYTDSTDSIDIMAIVQYILYRLYDKDLELNPFLSYFASGYAEWRGSETCMELVLHAILIKEQHLGREPVKNSTHPRTAIDWPLIEAYLKRQWFSLEDTRRITTGTLVWLYENSENANTTTYRQQDTDGILKKALRREAKYPSIDLEQFTNPFNKVSAEIFSFMLAFDLSSQTRATTALTRTRGTNLSVDTIHRAILNKELADDSLIPLLVYEFVLFNINGDSVSDSTVRMLCLMLLSLVRKNCLEPLQDYHLLFSSMLNFVGKVSEAQQVYALGLS